MTFKIDSDGVILDKFPDAIHFATTAETVAGTLPVLDQVPRTKYNYNRDAISDDTGLHCTDPSRTVQDFAEEADINTIVHRFGIDGQLPSDLRVPLEGDFEEVYDYQSALNQVRAADEAFMELPAHVRNRFHNDPGELLSFVADKANYEEAKKLGIINLPPPDSPPLAVRVIAEPAASDPDKKTTTK